jgi:[pyruvate, water dikinase]-phosphate phosphotransferase / [pyruvate, water dikinase] kinase
VEEVFGRLADLKKKVHVFIVSDATGMTAEMVISAVLVQFKEIDPVFKKFPYIKTKEQIKAILAQAEAAHSIVIYSFVSRELRSWMRREQRKINIIAIDLLGPLLERIGKMFNLIPSFSPGILRRLGEESIRLAESIDFTLKHDDGQGVETLEQADLILCGVSRTSKTPTSLYLSCNNNLKVANIPIIQGLQPTDKLLRVNVQKIGLTIAPERLAFIREKRMKYAGATDYLDLSRITQELDYSRRIFSQINGLKIIDVTNSSIEEVSNKITEWRQGKEG